MWCFPADKSDEDGLYYHMDKAVDMCFYEEVEEDDHAMKVKWDSLGYCEESLEGGIVRVGKGRVILDSRRLAWKTKLKLIYTQHLMVGFEKWMQCRDRIDYDAKVASNVPAVPVF